MKKNGTGSNFAACMWIYTRLCAYRGTRTHSRNTGVPEAKDVIDYALRELVSMKEEAFDDHEWVSEDTVRGSNVQVVGLRTLHSVCGAVEHAVVLSAHEVESNNGQG